MEWSLVKTKTIRGSYSCMKLLEASSSNGYGKMCTWSQSFVESKILLHDGVWPPYKILKAYMGEAALLTDTPELTPHPWRILGSYAPGSCNLALAT